MHQKTSAPHSQHPSCSRKNHPSTEHTDVLSIRNISRTFDFSNWLVYNLQEGKQRQAERCDELEMNIELAKRSTQHPFLVSLELFSFIQQSNGRKCGESEMVFSDI